MIADGLKGPELPLKYSNPCFPSERCPTQPLSPQVLQSGGERQGGGLDCGRGGVLSEETSEELRGKQVGQTYYYIESRTNCADSNYRRNLLSYNIINEWYIMINAYIYHIYNDWN